MNGKYMGWREQRWTSRDAKRLEHIKRKREKLNEARQNAAAKKEGAGNDT